MRDTQWYSLDQCWQWGRTDPFCPFCPFSLSPFRLPPDAMLEPSRLRRQFSAHGDGGEDLACSETDWEEKERKHAEWSMSNLYAVWVRRRGKGRIFWRRQAARNIEQGLWVVRERHTYWICWAWCFSSPYVCLPYFCLTLYSLLRLCTHHTY